LLICAKAFHCSPECHAIICSTESRGRGHSAMWLKDRNSQHQSSADNHYYLTKELPFDYWHFMSFTWPLELLVYFLSSRRYKKLTRSPCCLYIYISYNK
jgi:hypothetical protein